MLFSLLDAEGNAGMELTDGFAMLPTAAVSGYYFSHPKSQYFVVGRVSKEQVADYAKRQRASLQQAGLWLASTPDYDPERPSVVAAARALSPHQSVTYRVQGGGG